MNKRKIIELKNVRLIDKVRKNELLRNVNIAFYEGENVAISSRDANDFGSCKSFVELLAGILKPYSGEISYARFDNSRKYNSGYNNFDNILQKKVTPRKIMEALFKSEDNISPRNKEEIYEIANFLSLDKFFDIQMSDLEHSERHLFNLLFLLIIKPRILFLQGLVLPGTRTMHAAILKFIRSYLDKYNITLIVATNDTLIKDELCERYIEILNHKIEKDKFLVKQQSYNQNSVNNKTVAFDVNDLVDSLSNDDFNNYKDDEYNAGNYSPRTIQMNDTEEKSRRYYRTKELSHEDKIDEFVIPKSVKETEALLDDFDEVLRQKRQDYDSFHSSNVDFKNLETGLERDNMRRNASNIHNQTRELRLDSDKIMGDIRLSSPNTNSYKMRGSPFVTQKIDDFELTDEFIRDLTDTYIVRNQLEQQIKSPEFVKLSLELQNKVFDNYDRANRLIMEHDPDGLYDITKTSNLRIVDNPLHEVDKKTDDNSNLTKIILSEEMDIDNDDRDERLENIYRSKTSEFDVGEFDDSEFDESDEKTLNAILEDVSTAELYTDDDSGTVGGYQYHNNIPSTTSVFNRSFNTGRVNMNSYEYNRPPVSNYYSKELYSTNSNEHEPNSGTTSKFKTKVATKSFDDTPSEPPSKPSKPLKTKAIKTRNKKNKIEEIYEEALADEELIEEWKTGN